MLSAPVHSTRMSLNRPQADYRSAQFEMTESAKIIRGRECSSKA